MLIWANRDADGRADGNLLIRALSPSDRRLIEPHLQTVALDEGEVAMHADAPIDMVLFPATGIFAVEERVSGRAHIEVALVGSEGLVGWPALLGVRHGGPAVVVRMQGAVAERLPVAALMAACDASRTLYRTLLLFVQTIAYQMARGVACDLESSLDQRIARWLLMRHDRIVGDQLMVRHDEIADALNARRASITNRLHLLEGDHVIRSRRGRLLILDRAGLEAVAGACYGAAETEYRRLIGPMGKIAAGAAPPVPLRPRLAFG